jgi:hypothetical protein
MRTVSPSSVIYVLLNEGNEFAAEEGLVAERSRPFVGGKMASLR